MKFFLCLSVFIVYQHLGELAQPYFPSQIVFSIDDKTTIAVDEINQRAYQTIVNNPRVRQTLYALKKFPYSTPDSPQSKNPVQLTVSYPWFECFYATYWKYAKNTVNSFPLHWLNNGSFEIRNYINFNDTMIHSTNAPHDEDYWYSSKTCTLNTREKIPCEQIYFKKNTDIPLRSTITVPAIHGLALKITNYKVISIGKPDDKYFEAIPTNWSTACRDTDLGVLYTPQSTKINLNETIKIQVRLTTPSHQINGDDTVEIEWRTTYVTDALTWTPRKLSFNGNNFHEPQILRFTRMENSPRITLVPFFNGGGFDHILSDPSSIEIE